MMVRRIMYRINYANVDETFFYTVGTIHSEESIADMTIFYTEGPGSTLVELPMHNEFSGLARVPQGRQQCIKTLRTGYTVHTIFAIHKYRLYK